MLPLQPGGDLTPAVPSFGSRKEQKLPGAAPAVPSKTADKKPDAKLIEAKDAAIVATESAAADAAGKDQSS